MRLLGKNWHAALVRTFLAVALLASGLTGPADAQEAPAGQQIRNTAEATFFNTGLGIVETVKSNTVLGVISAMPMFEISGQSDLVLARGASSFHQYLIENKGNVELEMTFSVLDTGDAAAITNRRLYVDLNGNGIVDNGDAEISFTEPVTLPVGNALSLIYAFTVSAETAPGDAAFSQLVAEGTAMGGSAVASGEGQARGSVRIVDAAIQLEKSAETRETDSGTEITYRLRLYNNSLSPVRPFASVDGTPITVDGAPTSGVLIHDAIPVNTRLVAARSTRTLRTLYRLYGQGEHAYVTTPPADLGEVAAIAYLHDGAYAVGTFREMFFTVLRPKALSGAGVRNVAQAYMPEDGTGVAFPSNVVALPGQPGGGMALDFMNPQDWSEASYGDTGADTALRAASGLCNTSSEPDRVEISVVSERTGDTEMVMAMETGPNTGIFRSAPLPVAEMSGMRPMDGVMAAMRGDMLIGKLNCGGEWADSELMIAPGLTLFDSVTNAPVESAMLELQDMSGATMAMSMSETDGYAGLGMVPAGDYVLKVTPPAAYSFPTERSGFIGFNRRVDSQASYGRAFRHPGGPIGMIDVPLDPFYGIPLGLEKVADRQKVQSGEAVRYSLSATNNMQQALFRSEIRDRLPRDAQFVPGSGRINGERIADPRLREDGTLVFKLGRVAPMQTSTVTYLLRFGPSAESGDRVNEAVLIGWQAGTGTERVSNTARAVVELNTAGGVFSREATVLGTVFMDCNGNGIIDGADERGVPGVRIVTQQGLAVVTDKDGKYSLFGLAPKSHVLALQSSTLPRDTAPLVSRAADMLQPGSRLMALKRGELRAENFPLEGCSPETLIEIENRAARLAERAEGNRNLQAGLPIGDGDVGARAARSEAGLATSSQIYRQEGGFSEEAAPASSGAQTESLETAIRGMEKGFGFIGVNEGQKVRGRNLRLRVRAPADLQIALELNGQPVGGDRLGEHAIWQGGNLQAMEFVALRLKPGANRLRLIGKDGFGIARQEQEITVTAPGDPSRIEIVAPPEVSATFGSAIPVVVRILDAEGVPAQASAVVTLTAPGAEWDVRDIREEQPGLQAYIDNGEATFDLLAPQNAGPQVIEVKSSFGKASTRLLIKPDLNDRILVGIIEGSVGLRDGDVQFDRERLSPFEDTVTGLRGELYLKGRIRGDALLTLRYSSDRDTEDRLFRDIQTDEYYPVYGDSSERGFDAQSSGNLFVKVEKGASYVLYGDIAVEADDPAFELGGYRTVTTGAKAHWEGDRARVTVFAARTAQQNRIIEFSGRGVSGPYDLDLTGFREGSDLVEILVRDEFSGEILSVQRQRRLVDYTVDYFRNTIIFDAPVSQADLEGNPVSVRVTYQVEGQGAEKYWLYGAEGVVDLSDRTRAGLRMIRADAERGTEERFALDAAFLETFIGERSRLQAEIARSRDAAGQEGAAARIRYEYRTPDTAVSVEASSSSREFAPGGTSVRSGTDRVKLTYETRLNERATLGAKAEYVRDRIVGTERVEADVNLRRVLSDTLIRTDGLRWSRETGGEFATGTSVLLLQGAEWRPESTPGARFDFDLELPFKGDADKVLRIGGDYEVRSGLQVFGQVELTFGARGEEFKLAKLGAEYRFNDWLTGQSEVITTRESAAQMVQSLDGDWELDKNTRLTAGLEHSFDISTPDSSLTSLALGLKWQSRDERWIGDMALDQTFEEDGRTFFADAGLAGEINADWTVLARTRYAYDGRGTGADRHRLRTRAGVAYRPQQNARANLLAWYENQLERDTARSVKHLWSVAGTWDASPRLRLNGRYAGQFTSQRYDSGEAADGLVQLVQGGLTAEVVKNRLEASLNAYHMWDDHGNAAQAIGLEAGVVAARGVMLSAGYNHATDSLPNGNPFYDDGFYLKIRMKLDESLWDQLDQFLGG
jgi:uncharacterized repeat protein (TIGR01451 family)